MQQFNGAGASIESMMQLHLSLVLMISDTAMFSSSVLSTGYRLLLHKVLEAKLSLMSKSACKVCGYNSATLTMYTSGPRELLALFITTWYPHPSLICCKLVPHGYPWLSIKGSNLWVAGLFHNAWAVRNGSRKSPETCEVCCKCCRLF